MTYHCIRWILVFRWQLCFESFLLLIFFFFGKKKSTINYCIVILTFPGHVQDYFDWFRSWIRWRLFGKHDAITMWYKVIILCCLPKRKHFWTLFIPSKYNYHCLNIFEVTKGSRIPHPCLLTWSLRSKEPSLNPLGKET